MAQKYKTFNFDFDLGLSEDCFNVGKKGIADEIKNTYAKESIKTITKFNDFAQTIDKVNAAAFNIQLNQIENIEDIVSFQVYDNDNFIDYVVLSSSDYKIYYYNLSDINRELKSLNSIQLTSKPKFENFNCSGNNYLLITSKTDEMWVWDGINNPYEILDAPKISTLAVGLDRAFVTTMDNPYAVFYSNNNDPTEWTMSGDVNEIMFTDNLGKVLSVVSLGSYIYVIRDLGIVKISGGKNNDNFSYSKIYFASGRIFEQTICSVGDNIMFMSTEGLYKFDGLNTKKISNVLSNKIVLSNNDKAICFNGDYYLLTSDINNQTVLVILSLEEEIIHEILYQEIQSIFTCEINTKRYFGIIYVSQKTAKNIKICDKNCHILNNSIGFLYKTISLQLEPSCKKKTLKKLKFISKTDVIMKIITDTETFEYKIEASNYFQEKFLSIVCNTFSLEFSGGHGADISNISIEYSYEGEY